MLLACSCQITLQCTLRFTPQFIPWICYLSSLLHWHVFTWFSFRFLFPLRLSMWFFLSRPILNTQTWTPTHIRTNTYTIANTDTIIQRHVLRRAHAQRMHTKPRKRARTHLMQKETTKAHSVFLAIMITELYFKHYLCKLYSESILCFIYNLNSMLDLWSFYIIKKYLHPYHTLCLATATRK